MRVSRKVNSFVLTKKEIKKLKKKIIMYNKNLIFMLLKKTLVKSIQKNYKADLVKRIWIFEKNTKKYKSLEISSLLSKILQQIIFFSIVPIIEWVYL